MKRFKLIFQVLYVAVALGILYFSIDILMNTEQYLARIKLSSYVKFPKYIMSIFLIVSVFMLINFILEKLHIYRIKDGIKDLKEEIVHLKAKLYDKHNTNVLKEKNEADDDGAESENDE